MEVRGTFAKAAVVALSLVALGVIQTPDAPARHETSSAKRVATVALLTTRDFRVAVVATRLTSGRAPTADVSFAVARRVGSSWREWRSRHLDETYFWHTVSGPRAVCRVEIVTAGPRPQVVVRLLQSPALGCGRAYRLPLGS